MPSDMIESASKQRLRAKQIGGLPDYQTPPLYPVQLESGMSWLSLAPDDQHTAGVICGLNVTKSGWINYAPIPTPRMKIDQCHLVVEFTSLKGDSEVSLSLLYMDAAHRFHKQVSTPQVASGSRFHFAIPLDHVSRDAAFRCSLHVQLMEPEKTVVIAGTWIEVEGT